MHPIPLDRSSTAALDGECDGLQSRVCGFLPMFCCLCALTSPVLCLYRCNEVDSCCESFEHCVSCCMSPKNKPEERRKETYRAPNNKDSGLWADTFEYCLATCRTHSRSTSHENSYIGARHHCFSKLGKPMVSGCAACCPMHTQGLAWLAAHLKSSTL